MPGPSLAEIADAANFRDVERPGDFLGLHQGQRRSRKRRRSVLQRAAYSGDTDASLCVMGSAKQLHRADARATALERQPSLAAWPLDEAALIDRFDARALLLERPRSPSGDAASSAVQDSDVESRSDRVALFFERFRDAGEAAHLAAEFPDSEGEEEQVDELQRRIGSGRYGAEPFTYSGDTRHPPEQGKEDVAEGGAGDAFTPELQPHGVAEVPRDQGAYVAALRCAATCQEDPQARFRYVHAGGVEGTLLSAAHPLNPYVEALIHHVRPDVVASALARANGAGPTEVAAEMRRLQRVMASRSAGHASRAQEAAARAAAALGAHVQARVALMQRVLGPGVSPPPPPMGHVSGTRARPRSGEGKTEARFGRSAITCRIAMMRRTLGPHVQPPPPPPRQVGAGVGGAPG